MQKKNIYIIYIYIFGKKSILLGHFYKTFVFIRKKLLSANAAITKQRKQQYPPQICNIVSTHLYSVYPTVITVYQKTKYIYFSPVLLAKRTVTAPFRLKDKKVISLRLG